jgi:1-acyl-sn-glycerol-3-phosphate acyltransferase
MAKSELFKNKFFSWLIRKCGAFPVERGAGDNAAIDKAISDIEGGKAFVIFPEGTRSKDGNIGRAKSGIAVIAGKANAPVLPVCIKYGKKGFRRKAWVTIGEMIPAEEIAIKSDDRGELRRVSNLIMDNIKMLMDTMGEYGEPLPKQYAPKEKKAATEEKAE